MNTKLGNKINKGITAEIFSWENGEKILKLSKTIEYRQAMLAEYFNSQFAWNHGLPVPRPFELIEIDGRPGIIFEYIYGNTLMEYFVNPTLVHSNPKSAALESNYEYISRIAARLLNEIHKTPIENIHSQKKSIIASTNKTNYLPYQRESIMKSIHKTKYLKTSEKDLIINLLNSIPIKHQLCHGDPNLNNILIRSYDNKALLVDWMYASIGNPEADLAEYIINIKYEGLHKNSSNKFTRNIISIKKKLIDVFIDEYTKLSDITFDDIDSWIIPMSVKRLAYDIIGRAEKKLLVYDIRNRLKKYK